MARFKKGQLLGAIDGCHYKIPCDTTTLLCCHLQMAAGSSDPKNYLFVLHVQYNVDFSFSSFLFDTISASDANREDVLVMRSRQGKEFFNGSPLKDLHKGFVFLKRSTTSLSKQMLAAGLTSQPPDEFYDCVLAIENRDASTAEALREFLKSKGVKETQFYIFQFKKPCSRFKQTYDDAVETLVIMHANREKMKATPALLDQFGQLDYGMSLL